MWKYVQTTGDLFQDTIYVETGYSGAADGKNDPNKECQIQVGPIPRGWYDIGAQRDKPTPITLPLTADDPDHCDPPRSGFLIHGDNSTGTASTGCIIMSRTTREKIRDSRDTRLQVVRDSKLLASIAKRVFAVRRRL